MFVSRERLLAIFEIYNTTDVNVREKRQGEVGDNGNS